MTKYEEADKSIAAYDEAGFASVGRPNQSDRLDALAAVVVVDCEEAARDRSVNQVTRDFYRVQAAFFRTQVSS